MDESRQEELIDQIAERFRQWGVAGVASALLNGGRPLAFVGGQLLRVAQPALSLLTDPGCIADYATLLEQPDALGQLCTRLEEG